MQIKDFIQKNKFHYVSPDITDENFPLQEVEKGEPVIYNLEKKMSSKEILEDLKKKNLRPANIYEFMDWFEKNKESIKGSGKCYISFGSEFMVSDGYHRLPFVYACTDGDFEFLLGHFVLDWDAGHCFLCYPLYVGASGSSGELEKAIEICKANGLKIIKTVSKTVIEEIEL